jgi:hypothetical protein
MAQAAELSYLKPAAMMEGGRRYRVNVGANATPGSKYRTEYVNEDGGNERDYIEYGDYDDKGNFIPVREDGKEKVEVIEREDGSIIMIRFKETEKSTVSALLIPGDSKEEDIQGYGLEPAGPSTAERDTNKRIPKGIFNLEKHDGKAYKNVAKLYREEKDEQGKPCKDNVPKDRYILMHQGNNYLDTEACIVVGDTWEEQGKIWDSKANKGKGAYVIINGEIERENVLGGAWIEGDPRGPSRIKLDEIREYFKKKGYENVKLHMLEELPDKEKKQAN